MTLEKASQARRHSHIFDEGNPLAEKSTLHATILSVAMMVAEVVGGYWFNSMALLAAGWHMVAHSMALGLSVLAYVLARRNAGNNRFVFGTWKIEILGAYTSAIFLVLIALLMLWQSASRIVAPSPIAYNEAIFVTIVGLLVNFICAWMLRGGSGHGAREKDAEKPQKDLNLRSAYLHVIADAATSVLAVIALVAGKWWGILWMDPLMGILGAVMVLVWAWELLRDTGRVLLTAEDSEALSAKIRETLANPEYRTAIVDMHLWRVGRVKYSCVVTVVTDSALTPDGYREILSAHPELAHVVVEVNPLAR